MSNAKFVNAETGEEIVIELTAAEIAELEAKQAAYKEQYQAAISAKATLLEKLGITEEEAKLLLS